jgi:FkbM family methyltransferase
VARKSRADKQARRVARKRARRAELQRGGTEPSSRKAEARRSPATGRVARSVTSTAQPETAARTAFFEQAQDYTPLLGVETDEGTFVVATRDAGAGQGLFVERGRPEFRVLRVAVRAVEFLLGDDAVDGTVFVDIGANIGTETVAALRSHRFGSAVCCEPEAANYDLLRANLVLNDLVDRTQALRVAASNRGGRGDLVILADRSGNSWIATDPGKIRDAEERRAKKLAENPALDEARRGGPRPEIEVAKVELVTLDRLVDDGIIDAERVGMLWVDAEGHEGQILEGASRLTETGVPVVFEFHPQNLDRRGDRRVIHELAERSYTHFIDVRRRPADRTQPRYQLRPVRELSRLADRFLDPSSRAPFTDVLMLRLDAKQASLAEELPDHLAKPAPAAA